VVPFDLAADFTLTILEFESGCAEESVSLVAGERVGEEVTARLAAED
jgi:hypothetical protein